MNRSHDLFKSVVNMHVRNEHRTSFYFVILHGELANTRWPIPTSEMHFRVYQQCLTDLQRTLQYSVKHKPANPRFAAALHCN